MPGITDAHRQFKTGRPDTRLPSGRGRPRARHGGCRPGPAAAGAAAHREVLAPSQV